MGGVDRSLGYGLGGWLLYRCVVSLNFLCRWQVHVSVYCARRMYDVLNVDVFTRLAFLIGYS